MTDKEKVKAYDEALERYLSCLQRLGTGNPQQPETINSKWFKEHCHPQPKLAWSEEDDRNLDRAIFYVRHYQRTNGVTDGSEECLNWLKSLRSQQISRPNINRTVWKPSVEQMKAFTDFVVGNEYDAHALAHLWAELKELSERLIS